VSYDEPEFEGHGSPSCEHRTVGPHRAWCHQCQEWCYPRSPCARCVLHRDRRVLALTDQMRDLTARLRDWRDNTAFHHIWIANGPLWWLCRDCRAVRR
jgi:hypothetical protein